MVCVLRFSRTFLGKNAQFQNMCAKKTQWFSTTKKNFQSGEVQNRRNYQSSWITWPIRLWLLWGIVLWKERLCKTWIVFFFDKMHMLYNQNKSCVKSCKKHCFKKKHCFPKKPIVLPKNPLFSNMCTFLSHCFETKNYHWMVYSYSDLVYTNSVLFEKKYICELI